MKTIRLDPQCVRCLLNKNLFAAPAEASKEVQLAYMQRVLSRIAQAPCDAGAPVLVHALDAIKREMFGIEKSYETVKRHFNALMLEHEAELDARICASKDPLKTAIQYAMIGNYIDFGALENVDETALEAQLAAPERFSLQEETYEQLRSELSAARRLVYLTDNCGEIVLDKLLIRMLSAVYPQLRITVIVRGAPVLNDATIEDAQQVGLTALCRVIDNGNGIAGTHFPALGAQAREAIDTADVILAKGQANYETMRGCGLNVFYVFLCKCELFASRFGVEKFAGMLVHDSSAV